jgi:CHAT domain-containing protein/tetratricopeptide (TPR) repeat protein
MQPTIRGRSGPAKAITVALLASAACARAPQARAPEPSGAVFLAEVGRGSPLARAGLEAGDRLVAWRRADARGIFDSWDDLPRLEIEQAPLGAVSIDVERGARRFTVDLPEDRWRSRARPALDPAQAVHLRTALEAFAARDFEVALAAFEALRLNLSGPGALAWLEMREAALPAAVLGPDSDPWSRAQEAAASAGDSAMEGWVASERCSASTRAARFDAAHAACESALLLAEGRGARLAALHVRFLQADLAGREGDPRASERLYRAVLADLEPIAPESLFVSRALRGIARERSTQDDLAGAIELSQRALALVERRAPRSIEHEGVLNMVAIFHWFRAEWTAAEEILAEAQEILEAIDPEHEEMANVLGNIAMVAAERGNLAKAEEYHLRALAERAKSAPDPLQESRSYNNLATLAARRGDYATAIGYDRRVLALRERIAPQSIDLVVPLINLGEHSRRAGRSLEAIGYLERALEVQRRHVPDSRDEAYSLVALGEAQAALKDPRAEATLEAALAIAERRAPASVVTAAALAALGERRAERGDLASADRFLARAVAILGHLTPGTLEEALALFDLGRVRRRAGDRDAALSELRAAADALDRQFGMLGGTDEIRARYRESWRRVYDELADLLLEMGREEESFVVLERARASAFLYLLRARQIDITAGLPAELAAERDAIAAALSGIEERLAGADARSAPLAGLDSERRVLRQRRDRLAERIGEWSPRLARLEGALGVEAARAALGDETTAISYWVGETTTRAWILGPGQQLEMLDLRVGESELRDLVDRFRLLLETSREGTDPRPLGEELYRLLVAPFADLVRTPSLVMVPDGPLHHLPFAALVAGGQPGAERYLVEWKPLQLAGSLTAWAELRERAAGPRSGAAALVAFADPSPPPRPRLGEGPAPPWSGLPHGRHEAERVAQLFGGAARAYVGRSATELAAKHTAKGAQYLHFATHAFVDTDSPLDSALVLAPGAGSRGQREDGLLEAWEVIRELDLDAALVVLSGCDTGAGALIGDEGILGLTRAFHFAGARAVLASLWKVPDRGTARLMESFYGALSAGRRPDQALRIAQLAMLEQAETRAPNLWAAFELFGASEGAAPAPIASLRVAQ